MSKNIYESSSDSKKLQFPFEFCVENIINQFKEIGISNLEVVPIVVDSPTRKFNFATEMATRKALL